MNLISWEPFRDINNLFRRYGVESRLRGDDMFDDEWTPTANISETDREYLIKAELPEVRKEDVKVTLQDGVITLEGERKREKEQAGESDILVESFYGTFSRSFTLPKDANAQAIRAESRDGVLQIHIPKTPSAKPKPIAIDVR